MAVTPTGSLSKPMLNLKLLLAESSTFQAWVGAANATEALDSIHIGGVDSADVAWPFAVIDLGEKITHTKFSEVQFQPRGELELYFEDEVDAAYSDDRSDALLEFTNNVGGCIDDMLSASGLNGFLSITTVEFDETPSRSIDDDEPPPDDYYRTNLVIEWGY